jgi:hypothetical protein
MEYAVIDSMGRNKGWHMHGFVRSLDDVNDILATIQKKHPKKSIKSKVYEYTLAFGSRQIA